MVYRGLFSEFRKYGKIADLFVCDNLHSPLRGSLYVVYEEAKSGEKCRRQMLHRMYDGRELKPVIIEIENPENLICPAFQKDECSSSLILIIQTITVPRFT